MDKQAARPTLTNFCLKNTSPATQLAPVSPQLILPLFRKHLKTRSHAQILLSICFVSIVIKLRPTIRDLKEKCFKKAQSRASPLHTRQPAEGQGPEHRRRLFSPITTTWELNRGAPAAVLLPQRGIRPPSYTLLKKQPARRQHIFNSFKPCRGVGSSRDGRSGISRKKTKAAAGKERLKSLLPIPARKVFL